MLLIAGVVFYLATFYVYLNNVEDEASRPSGLLSIRLLHPGSLLFAALVITHLCQLICLRAHYWRMRMNPFCHVVKNLKPKCEKVDDGLFELCDVLKRLTISDEGQSSK